MVAVNQWYDLPPGEYILGVSFLPLILSAKVIDEGRGKRSIRYIVFSTKCGDTYTEVKRLESKKIPQSFKYEGVLGDLIELAKSPGATVFETLSKEFSDDFHKAVYEAAKDKLQALEDWRQRSLEEARRNPKMIRSLQSN